MLDEWREASNQFFPWRRVFFQSHPRAWPVVQITKTTRRHVDNLWILGGEIIRDLNYTPSLREVTASDFSARQFNAGAKGSG